MRQELGYLDLHCAGEPFRLLTEPMDLPGATMEERRRYVGRELGGLRRLALCEPRGHSNMYGGIMCPPVRPASDLGIVFLTTEGTSTMCGHGTLCLGRAAVELGLREFCEGWNTLRVDAPSATVDVGVEVVGGEVRQVAFVNDRSFACEGDFWLDGGLRGRVGVQVAYGGAFMVFVRASELGVDLESARVGELLELAGPLYEAASRLDVAHPEDGDKSIRRNGCCLILASEPVVCGRRVRTRTFTTFGRGLYDRSPTGTGSSALAALLVRDGVLGLGGVLENRGPSGIPFEVQVGPAADGRGGIVPTVCGQAFVTGRGTLVLEGADPLQEGLSLL